MKIETKVTFKEYVRLLYSLTYAKPMMKFLVGLAILLVVWIVGYYSEWIPVPTPIIYQYITLCLIAVVQPLAIYITIYRNYHSSNHLRETLKMEILPDKMKIEGESFYLEVKWDKLFKIKETLRYFLIYQNTLSAIIIAKNDLQPADIKNLKDILKRIKYVPVHLLPA